MLTLFGQVKQSEHSCVLAVLRSYFTFFAKCRNACTTCCALCGATGSVRTGREVLCNNLGFLVFFHFYKYKKNLCLRPFKRFGFFFLWF